MNEPQGFEALAHLKRLTGLAQSQRQESIRFAYVLSSFGSMLLAASEKGLCALSMGEDQDALFCDLRQKFPDAALSSGEPADFYRFVDQVTEIVNGSSQKSMIPLDIRGTHFQKRVWQALRDIPCGTKVTYASVAEKIGSPRSVRAVAGACAANKIAILIPCHRVVRRDGRLSGYRWGIELKRRLLEREARS